jgi:hypothetical protein
LIIGISKTQDYFEINHYNIDFDLSEYLLVDDSYNLDKYLDQWFDWVIDDFEKNIEKNEGKLNV